MVKYYKELPDFLKRILHRKNNTVFGSDGVEYFITPSDIEQEPDVISKLDIFKRIYFIAKSDLNLNFNHIDQSTCILPISSEIQFINYNKTNEPYFTIPIVLDIPIYWFDESNNCMCISILEKGMQITFSSFNTSGNASPWLVHLYYYFNLFSNELNILDSQDTIYNNSYVLYPAARLNRLLIRNLALEIKTHFNNTHFEFVSDVELKFPKDEFGFIESN